MTDERRSSCTSHLHLHHSLHYSNRQLLFGALHICIATFILVLTSAIATNLRDAVLANAYVQTKALYFRGGKIILKCYLHDFFLNVLICSNVFKFQR
jgi:hypothetical protein